MANDPELKIKISAQVADLTAQLDRVKTELRQLGEAGDAAGRRSGAGLSAMGAGAARAAAAIGVAVAGAAIFVKRSIDAADATGILAGKLGITTEALSKLQYAAKLSDVSQQSLEAGLRGLTKTLLAATDPASSAAESLAAIGLSARDLLDLPADQQIGAIADALSRVENPSLQAGLSLKIFGKAGQDLLPLMQEGSAGINRMGAELQDLGGVMSGEVVAQAMAFNDHLDTLKTAAQGLGLAVARELLPQMNGLAREVINLAKQKETAEGIAAFITGIGNAVIGTAKVIAGTGNVFTFLGQEIAALVNGAAVGDLERLYEQLDRLQTRRTQANPNRPDVIQHIDDEIAKVTELIRVSEDLEVARVRAQLATEAATGAGKEAVEQGDKQVISEQQVTAALQAGSGERDKAARAAEQRQKAIDDLIAKLQEEVDTQGQAESATVDYKLAQLGATEAERARAAALAETNARLKEQEAAQDRIKDQLPAVQNDLLRLQGDDALAAENDLRQRYAQLLADLQLMGNQAGIAIVEKLINLSVADARLNELKGKIAEVTSAFDQAQQNAANRVATGDQSGGAARNDVGAAGTAAIEQLQAYRQELQKLADEGIPGALEALDALGQKQAEIAAQSGGGMVRAVQDLRKELAQMQEDFAGDSLRALRDNLAGLFYDLAEGSKSAKESLKDFARGFALAMVEIAARALATWAVLMLIPEPYRSAVAASMQIGAKVKHTGGVAGQGGTTRQVPGWVFAGAARYHTGGIAGLAPGEVPAILRRGEEVITENDPRHIANGGGTGGGVQNVRINLLDDRSNVGDYMSSADGERVLLETLERNAMRARTVLGMG